MSWDDCRWWTKAWTRRLKTDKLMKWRDQWTTWLDACQGTADDLSIDFDVIWLRLFIRRLKARMLSQLWHYPFVSHGSSMMLRELRPKKIFACFQPGLKLWPFELLGKAVDWLSHLPNRWPMDVASVLPKSFTLFRWNWATSRLLTPFPRPACIVHFSEVASLAPIRSLGYLLSMSGSSQLLSMLICEFVWLGWFV